jgi:hypothetical protein
MRTIEGTAVLTAVVTMLMAPPPSTAQEAMYRPCAREDLACRLDRLERTVAEMAEARAPWRTPAPPRSVDVPVDRPCGGTNCSTLAAEVCRTAGFPRGVPAEVRDAFGSRMLVRATCMD